MNKTIAFFLLLLTLLFPSCDMFVTNPNPLLGYYKVSRTYGSVAAYYYYMIDESGYFVLYQSGGMNSADAVIYEGIYDMKMSQFDFFNASGTIDLFVTSFHGKEESGGLALSSAEGKNDNPFTFVWKLNRETGVSELVLSTLDEDLCKLPGTGFSISKQEFERATGWVIE